MSKCIKYNLEKIYVINILHLVFFNSINMYMLYDNAYIDIFIIATTRSFIQINNDLDILCTTMNYETCRWIFFAASYLMPIPIDTDVDFLTFEVIS